jgi:hypothetical protein
MKFIAMTACALLSLTGCATKPLTPARWSKAGGTQEMFMQDRYACLQQAQQPRTAGIVDSSGGSSFGTVVTSQGLLVSCMGARGYTPDPAGPFAPPPEAVVQTVR